MKILSFCRDLCISLLLPIRHRFPGNFSIHFHFFLVHNVKHLKYGKNKLAIITLRAFTSRFYNQRDMPAFLKASNTWLALTPPQVHEDLPSANMKFSLCWPIKFMQQDHIIFIDFSIMTRANLFSIKCVKCALTLCIRCRAHARDFWYLWIFEESKVDSHGRWSHCQGLHIIMLICMWWRQQCQQYWFFPLCCSRFSLWMSCRCWK